MRRRRRRSSFSSGPRLPQQRWIIAAVAGVAVIGGFLFFMRQADELAPAPKETRVELPDAFKD